MTRLITILACALAPLFAAWGQTTVTIDGITYATSSSGATIQTVDASLTGDIVIPGSIECEDTSYTVRQMKATFASNANITSISLPDSITSLPMNCFYGCTSLASVKLPEGITSLGDMCFQGCTSLTSINLPEGITSIGRRCFFACNGLYSVTCRWKDNIIIGNPFTKIGPECILYVPGGTAELYNKTSWSAFKNIVEKELGEYSTLACETPSIAYADGKLTFSCETEGAAYDYIIRNADEAGHTMAGNGTVAIGMTYQIYAYAFAPGYHNSVMAKATLCILDPAQNSDGIEVAEGLRGIVAQQNGQTLAVSGLEADELVELFDAADNLVASAIANAQGTATLATGDAAPNVVLKAGDTAVKITLD